MLTADIIKQSEALSDLPEDKVQALVTLAQNVFKEEIDTYAGTTKRRWEEDIKSLYGADKPDPKMPAHEFLRTAWQERERKFKEELEAAKGNPAGLEEIENKYKRTIETLQSELKDAALKGSELLKQDLEGYRAKTKDLETLAETLKKDHQKERKEWEAMLMNERKNAMLLEINFERDKSLSGVELDPRIPESAQQTIIDARWSQVLSKFTPERVKMDDGSVVTQWRDKENNIVRNPNNNREPYTTKELILEELKDVLKQGRTQGGAGTQGGSGNGSHNIDLSGARTQVEFDEKLGQLLLAQGLSRGSTAYMNKETEFLAQYKDVRSKLPLR